jgi:hypothetical protein
MDAQNGPKPRHLPDMSLPDRVEPVQPPSSSDVSPKPLVPASAIPSSSPLDARAINWHVGDRVLAPWEPVFLYVGTIVEMDETRARVEFEDGDSGWVLCEQLRPFALPLRQKLLARKPRQFFYFPAEVTEIDGDDVRVHFETGESEWLDVADLRFPCQPIGPAAETVRAASQAIQFDAQPGDRVWAPWAVGTLFVGTVDRFNEDRAFIRFDDGDRGWVLRSQLFPFTAGVGMQVCVRRGNQYLPAQILEENNGGFHVEFQDGVQQWASPAAFALPGPANGPAAKPSGFRYHSWWIWIAVFVGMMLLRGCRAM